MMLFAPAARLAPFTSNAAVDPVAEAVRAAVPSTVFPNANATRPAGALLPLACFTVAVNTVDPLCAIAAGFAFAVIEVPIAGAVTVTVAVAVELLKPDAAA
jgi:hypothetical protein